MSENKLFGEALKKIFRYLSFRQRSKKEVFEYLQKKGYGKNLISEVIEYLESSQLVDDHKFAEEWIFNRSKKGNGSYKLRHELRNKGIDNTIIENTLISCLSEEQEYQVAKSLIEKKLMKRDLKEDKTRFWNRVTLYLKGRGYSYALVEKLIKEFHDSYSD